MPLRGERRGESSWDDLTIDSISRGSNDTDGLVRGLGDGLQHPRDGGFAIGACDSDEGQGLRRVTVKGCGQLGQSTLSVGHLNLSGSGLDLHGPLDHDGLGLNLSSVVMTIRTLPLQGNEDHPRTTHTGVLGQCRDGAVDGA